MFNVCRSKSQERHFPSLISLLVMPAAEVFTWNECNEHCQYPGQILPHAARCSSSCVTSWRKSCHRFWTVTDGSGRVARGCACWMRGVAQVARMLQTKLRACFVRSTLRSQRSSLIGKERLYSEHRQRPRRAMVLCGGGDEQGDRGCSIFCD